MQEDSGSSQCFQSFKSVFGEREKDGRKERTKLRTSQIYCYVSNFKLSTYLSETLIKKKLVCKKQGWMLAKSAQAQRGRRLRAIDPTSIRSLCAAIDQTGERPGEPEHTAPNQNKIENNLTCLVLNLCMCAIEAFPLYAMGCLLSLIGWRSAPNFYLTFSFG